MTSDRNKITRLISSKGSQIVFFIILSLGLFLRFYQYFMGRSLWEDETHLALNFMKYDFLRLMQPLDHIQAAPVFFILAVKCIVSLFGYGELAFRFIPFIASVLTFPLFYFIIVDLLKNKVIAGIGFFIFAVNLALIYFSSELKQYATDVSVYLLLIYLTVGSNHFVQKNRILLLSISGCISILFSSIAFIVLTCISCSWFVKWYQQKKIETTQIKVMLIWLIVFLINYFLFIHNHPSTLDQRTNYAFAFCPTDLLSCEFTTFLKKTIEETFFTLLLYVSKAYGFAYMLLGIFVIALRHLIVKKKYTILLLICAPVLFHLFLSALKLYPFWYRLILYLIPCFIFLMAYGTYLIATFIGKYLKVYSTIAVVCVCCYFLVKESLLQFPLWFREIKPALNFVDNNISPNAHVYIMDPVNAYDYYQQRAYVKNKIHRALKWEINTSEFQEIVYNETSNYILFYGTGYQWGYNDILEDLKQQNLIVKKFEYKGYGVIEVKPPLRDTSSNTTFIDYTYFDKTLVFGEEKEIAIWSGSIESKPIPLKKGKYRLSILSKGSPVDGTFPEHNLFLNNLLLGNFQASAQLTESFFSHQLLNDTSVVLKIVMTNDFTKGSQDRNSFIKRIRISEVHP